MSYHSDMSEKKNARVAVGTLVNYHGSLEYAHGLYVVTHHDEPLHSQEKYEDGVAYVLAPADETGKRKPFRFDNRECLSNARVTSFTPVDPKVANPSRTKVE